MKKILLAATFVSLLIVGHRVKAQDLKEIEEVREKKERAEGQDKKEKAEKKETKEIIIRQNGDKDVNLKVEINGDNVTINGKPLSEFKDKNITINKRKMTITGGNDMLYFNSDNFGDKLNGELAQAWGENENSNRPFLGVTTEDADNGVKIKEVVKGSAAEKAGLKKGDIITKIADEKIISPESLTDVIGFRKPADEIKITYKRDGKESTAKATLGKRKNQVVKTFRFNGPNGSGAQSFGPAHAAPFTNMEGYNQDIQEITQNALADAFPFRKKIGLKIQDTEDGGNVKVINVEDSSAAATAGMKKDDLITEINGRKIDNTDDAREELVPDEDKRSYKIKALRNGVEMTFDVKIPRKLKTANL